MAYRRFQKQVAGTGWKTPPASVRCSGAVTIGRNPQTDASGRKGSSSALHPTCAVPATSGRLTCRTTSRTGSDAPAWPLRAGQSLLFPGRDGSAFGNSAAGQLLRQRISLSVPGVGAPLKPVSFVTTPSWYGMALCGTACRRSTCRGQRHQVEQLICKTEAETETGTPGGSS
jgi:hypothetical protein